MLNKSLMSLIGIFAVIFMLSSCSAIRATSVPVDDSSNNTIAGGGGVTPEDPIIPPEEDVGVEGVIYVNQLATGKADGTSWTNAFTDLQDAIIEVGLTEGKDEIWVAKGTYKPSVAVGGEGDRYKSFIMLNNVAIYGGFAGDEVRRDARDFLVNETILSGDLDIDGKLSDGDSYHVFNLSVSNPVLDETAVLDGFIITGGNANGSAPNPEAMGGGIASLGNSMAIRNCVFTENYAVLGGAIMLAYGGSSTINDSVFRDNNAGDGGSIYIYGSEALITDCSFSDNTSVSNGGAITSSIGTLSVVDSVFTENSSEVSAGAVSSTGSSTTITNCEFSSNTAGVGGGAMTFYQGTASIIESTFSENSSGSRGGAILSDSTSSLSISDSTFNTNATDGYGGALHLSDVTSTTITDSTFSGNTAALGAGAINSWTEGDAVLSIADSTFSGNSCEAGAGAVANQGNQILFDNLLFSGNTSVFLGGAIFNNGASGSITDSRFFGNYVEPAIDPENPDAGVQAYGGAMFDYNESNITTTGCTFFGNSPEDYPPAEPVIAVGTHYKGGIIAYVDGTGSHGFIAAANDLESPTTWGASCLGFGTKASTDLGTGQANATLILGRCGAAGIATTLCDNLRVGGYTDWYLPSRDELVQLRSHKTTIGGFASSYYWSSSEYMAEANAWIVDFSSASLGDFNKGNTYPARCIRSF